MLSSMRTDYVGSVRRNLKKKVLMIISDATHLDLTVGSDSTSEKCDDIN